MSEFDAIDVDEDDPPVQLTADQIIELATAYVSDQRAGSRQPVAWDARDTWSEVFDCITDGPDPLALLDAILAQETEDDELAEDVGLGWLVVLVTRRPDLWDALDERCRQDPRWAAAARYAFTDDPIGAQLPPLLASLIRTSGPDFTRPLPHKEHSGTKRRPSKRQDRRGRQR